MVTSKLASSRDGLLRVGWQVDTNCIGIYGGCVHPIVMNLVVWNR